MITLGTDPEVCVVDNDGQVVPSGWCFDKWAERYDIIMPPPPEPDMPPKGRKLYLDTAGCALYEDGASLEFNTPAMTSPDTAVTILGRMLHDASAMVEETGYHIEIKAALPITDEVIKRGGVALSRFGCDPDSTMWDDRVNPASIDARTCYHRFYGGHIHMGNPSPDPEFFEAYRWEMTLCCDALLGLADVLIDHSPEAKTRRSVYGRIGRHRIQRYPDGSRGFEYRVPSNGWLTSPILTGFMFSVAQVVGKVVTSPDGFLTLLDEKLPSNDLKQAINTTNPKLAHVLYSTAVAPFLRECLTYDLELHQLDLDPTIPLYVQPTDWKANWGIS